MFNEITKKGVLAALEHPTTLNKQLVDAQQARRVLDRLVGYKISPLLWEKVRRGLTAGRVQSVALKLICDREREIEAFVPEEYWNIRRGWPARCRRRSTPGSLQARRREREGRQPGRGRPGAVATCAPPTGSSSSVTTKERKKHAVPPYITSQAAAGLTLPGQEDDEDRAGAVRGHRAAGEGRRRPHHVHAYRLDARRRSRRSTDVREHIGDEVRAGLRAREAEHLQDEEGRAGRARSDPSDVDAVATRSRSGRTSRPSSTSSTADLEPLRRVADDAGDLRRHDRRHHARRSTSSA